MVDAEGHNIALGALRLHRPLQGGRFQSYAHALRWALMLRAPF